MPREVWPSRQLESIRSAEMAYASSAGNPHSNWAPTVRNSVNQLILNEVYALAWVDFRWEKRCGAEAAVPTYRQMPRYRRQVRREMPSFFILDWSVVRFMPRLTAAPEGPPTTPWASRRARRICSRSAAFKQVEIPSASNAKSLRPLSDRLFILNHHAIADGFQTKAIDG
jgi:hypothetical protein